MGMSKALQTALARLSIDEESPIEPIIQRAILLARMLQERAGHLQTPDEKKQLDEMYKMILSPSDKATVVQMTDEAFRPSDPGRAVDQLIHILDVQGIPHFFSPVDQSLLQGFKTFGDYLPAIAIPFVKGKIRSETSNVILPAEPQHLRPYLAARQEQGLRMNVNLVGESLLDETEAFERLQRYLTALQTPEIEVLSVKISTIFSQITPIAHDYSVNELCDRLELLYRAAARERFHYSDGSIGAKMVYLDMEEYRDMEITADAFMQALDRPGLENACAGIALQAYIPDAYLVQQQINEWARKRVENGGGDIILRIVKGANMEMERVLASLQDWPQAPYKTKIETDANYRRMLHEGLKPDNIAAVRMAVASHNLFELAYALVLGAEKGCLDRMQFEMLEGMANHQRRAVFELAHNLLLYAPACRKKDFIYAIGYLIRRMDENTGPENFLRHAFGTQVGSLDWESLERSFAHSFSLIQELSSAPRQTQDRHETPRTPRRARNWRLFRNDPDTNFSLPANRHWAEELVKAWRKKCGEHAPEIPIVVAGKEIINANQRQCLDPSRPGVVVGHYYQATSSDIARALACAKRDPDGWRKKPIAERAKVMRKVARELRKARGDLMGAALADGGKTLLESDPEVSEAIDFVEFYPLTAESFASLPGVQAQGKGVVVVVSPWNFPISIPCGGVAAALAAGNTVILKPASNTVLIAHELCKCFWRGGISRNTLQFVPCSGSTEGAQLVSDDRVDTVILTGGTETAQAMLRRAPAMNLLAETGGKNATIITAMADRDNAVKHVIHSAFSHSGQKCSATSLLILEKEVFEDKKFKESLCEAVRSMQVGPVWELKNRMGPMIQPPTGVLEKGLKELEPSESWLLLPRQLDGNPCLYSPGIKWNVQLGSFTHLTELFGPVLGVMRAENLQHAIELVNQTGYGLTSGLESLDDREQEEWKESIRAGNLYVNRGTTGAIVLRQPFGGMGKSAFGPGIKAGGPNYVAQLMDFRVGKNIEGVDELPQPLSDLADRIAQSTLAPKADRARLKLAIASYTKHWHEEFWQQHDHMRLIGQDNFRRYLPLKQICIRVGKADSYFDIVARVAAALTTGAEIGLSIPPRFSNTAIHDLQDWLGESLTFVEESDQELALRICRGDIERIRYAGPAPEVVLQTVSETGIFIGQSPVLEEGRIELLWYVQEQSLCVDYHRYGNLGARVNESRREPE